MNTDAYSEEITNLLIGNYNKLEKSYEINHAKHMLVFAEFARQKKIDRDALNKAGVFPSQKRGVYSCSIENYVYIFRPEIHRWYFYDLNNKFYANIPIKDDRFCLILKKFFFKLYGAKFIFRYIVY